MVKHRIAALPRLSRRHAVVGLYLVVLALTAFVGFKFIPTESVTIATLSSGPQPSKITNASSSDEQKMRQVVENEHARAAKERIAAQEHMSALRKHQNEQARQEAIARVQAQAYITQQREKMMREGQAAQQSEPTKPNLSHP